MRKIQLSLKNYDIAHIVISLVGGGTENLVVNLIERSPFKTCCICLDTCGPLAPRLEKIGVDVIPLGRKPGIAFNIPALIAQVVKNRNIKILHCHQYSPWFYGVLAKIYIPTLKIIYTEHGRPYPDIAKRKRKIFNTIFNRLTNCVTAVSPFIKDSLNKNEAFPKKKIKVIFNGIDIPEAVLNKSEARSKLNLEQGKIYAILPARFNPIKWHEGLIRAFAIVSEKNPNARLILLGIGEMFELVKSLIAELNLTNYVITPGYQINALEWMAASDIFVLSSHSEGTSVSLLESMAIGLPAAVTDVGGNPYIVEPEVTGLLSPRGDHIALAENLTILFSNDKLRVDLGATARIRFLQKYTFATMTDNYNQLYNSFLKK
jgi:glycosyltransferase involved in cell wall biosynthesis